MRAGDRFVLRSASPVSTLGGGVVTDPLAGARARPWPLEETSARRTLELLLADAGALGVAVKELPVRLGLSPSDADALVAGFQGWRVGDRLLNLESRDRLQAQAMDTLSQYHSTHPLEVGAPIQWLRSRLDAPDDIAQAVVATLGSKGEVVAQQGLVAKATYAPALSHAQGALKEAILKAVTEAESAPPSFDELASALAVRVEDVAAISRWLVRERQLIAVEQSRYYSQQAVQALVSRLGAGMDGARDYAASDLREMLDLTRKFLIPFLEYCDRESYTVRDGAGRRRLGTLARLSGT